MEGSEQCPSCLQLYAYELGYHCERCDEPLCPFCVVELGVWHFCVDCAEADDGGSGDVEG